MHTHTNDLKSSNINNKCEPHYHNMNEVSAKQTYAFENQWQCSVQLLKKLNKLKKKRNLFTSEKGHNEEQVQAPDT